MWIVTLYLILSAVSARPSFRLNSCSECRAAFFTLKTLADQSPGNELGFEVANKLCKMSHLEKDEVCLGLSAELGPVFLASLSDHYFDPDFACFKLGYCESPIFVKENLTDWMSQVLSDKPNGLEPVAKSKATVRFAHLTDLHFDMEYLAGSDEDCGLPLCCRSGSGKAGRWGSFKCDLPVETLDIAIKSLANQTVDFIVWTGDSPPHNVWNQSQAYQLSYITKATQLLRQHFPDTPIYPVLGNHGCYPFNIYGFGEEAWLTDTLSDLWGPFLPEGAAESLKTIGSYSVLHPGSKLRVISLNTQACYNYNFRLLKDATDPGKLIEWLRAELDTAERNGELVYIAGHLPPGYGDCLDAWSWHYNTLIERYVHIVKGQFFGHTHWDHFYINRGVFSGLPVAVEWVAPSLTSYTYLNPSYRIFEADAASFDIANIYQYRMNLAKAAVDPYSVPVWDLAYDFLSEYGVVDLKPETIAALYEQFNHDETLMVRYLNNKFTGGLLGPKECGPNCRQKEACEVNFGVNQLVRECQKSVDNISNEMLNFLFGPWVYKL
jgi:sphingomyelin phosphodiesterase